MTGNLTVYTGPMYAGKTTQLIRALHTYEDAVAVTPATDDRYAPETLSTHTQEAYPAQVVDPDKMTEAVADILDAAPSAVGFDEGQFYDETLLAAVDDLQDAGVDVYVAGLRQDFRREPWPPLSNLLADADTVRELTAYCETCGDDAPYTQRLIDGEPAHRDTDTVMVGGTELYEPRCGEHHHVPGKDG